MHDFDFIYVRYFDSLIKSCLLFLSVRNSLIVKKGDPYISGLGSIPGPGGWGLGTCAYRHICILNVNKGVS